MRKTLPILLMAILLAGTLHAQQRDRSTELNIQCRHKANLAPDGSIWLVTCCGELYCANDINSYWRTLCELKEDWSWKASHFEHVAPFCRTTAATVGYRRNSMLHTTTAGHLWDTIEFETPRFSEWFHPVWFDTKGHLWAGSQDGLLIFSADSGRTFTTLRDSAFERKMGIDDIYMVNADSGWIAGHSNRIYTTRNNWQSVRRWATPLDQKLYIVTDPHDQFWVNRIRPWQGHLVVHEAYWSFISPLTDSLQWRRTPVNLQKDFEVETLYGRLWARNDSGYVVMMEDAEHWKTFNLKAEQIVGIYNGRAYCLTYAGVVAIGADGKMDTCRFLSIENPIKEPPLVLTQGNRLWGADSKSVYMLDEGGWYRVARPMNIIAMNPDPDNEQRVIIMRKDFKHLSVDTAGNMEPYTFHHPLEDFVKKGIANLEIKTYRGGCFHYDEHIMRYERQADRLEERYNNVDSNRYITRHITASNLEEALRTLGDRYNLYPTPHDFGMEDTTVDLHEVYKPSGWSSSSYIGYRITIVNQSGDTLTVHGSTDAGFELGGHTRFPWMLPMRADWRGASFVTYQPVLWQVLKPLMPDGMLLKHYLDNRTLRPRIKLQSGDLLFYPNIWDSDMDNAISESTGKYVHVVLVEKDSLDALWFIDASPEKGVQRKKMSNVVLMGEFDIYRLTVPFDTAAVIERANSFVGQPYDNAFLPNNGALYCSELIYEAFLDADGNHLFKAKPMNWRNKKGKLPKYWKKHFKKLKMEVPEGVLGTNPTDMSGEEILKMQ